MPDLVKQIRTCESLDDVAESIIARESDLGDDDGDSESMLAEFDTSTSVPQFEKELSGKMGKMRLDNGSVSIVGGTSNLIFIDSSTDGDDAASSTDDELHMLQQEPVTSWTEVTKDPQLVMHLMNMYFTWHYTYFTTLSSNLFWRDFKLGRPPRDTKHKTEYCTSLLVNAMLSLGCHFTSWPAARADPQDSATAGDHFFREAKRLILENDEHEKPRLATVQAFALMSVREAGCGREARGWVYSGMSFRMAYDLGLNIDSGSSNLDDEEVDARRITIWGCFQFDKYVPSNVVDGSVTDRAGVGQTISVANLNYLSLASRYQNSTCFQWKTPRSGDHTWTLALDRHTPSLQGRVLSLFRRPSSVRLAATYSSTSTTRITSRSRWVSRQNLRS